MASFNRITIVGYLGRDPELRYTSDGTPVCDFSVATTERRKDRSGESQDITTWFRVTVWRRQAELASQYLSKGKQVYVEGRLIQREFQDRDGNTRYNLEVTASDVQFLGSRGDEIQGREESMSKPRVQEAPAAAPVTEDDIPF
jgi:single-strand DNA-binding protein